VATKKKPNLPDKKIVKAIREGNDSKKNQRWVRNDNIEKMQKKGWKEAGKLKQIRAGVRNAFGIKSNSPEMTLMEKGA